PRTSAATFAPAPTGRGRGCRSTANSCRLPWSLRTFPSRAAAAPGSSRAISTSTAACVRPALPGRAISTSPRPAVRCAPARARAATLGLGFNGSGRIDAQLRTGWDAYAPLEGNITAATSELTWLELFSPDIVSPEGRLDADVSLAGTRAQPRLGGSAALTGFSAEIPSLAIAIVDGQARLEALPAGSARISGTVRTGGDGRLAIDGNLGWQTEGSPLLLQVRGDNRSEE